MIATAELLRECLRNLLQPLPAPVCITLPVGAWPHELPEQPAARIMRAGAADSGARWAQYHIDPALLLRWMVQRQSITISWRDNGVLVTV